MALRPISRMDDYTFPTDAWDVRGWSVRTDADNERVGRVDDMLLDHDGSLRYLDVDVGYLKRHVLIPLDRAYADRQDETVRIEGLHKEQMEDLPAYALDPERLDEDYERRLEAFYQQNARSTAARGAGRDDMDGELELRRMDALDDDYEVAGDDPRGWEVVTADGREAGEVAELLMDPGEMRARFLDVVVDEKELDLEPVDRHILLPADRVRLDRDNKKVVVGGLFASDLADYPRYGGMPVSRRTEHELDDFFERAASPESRGEHERAAEPPARTEHGRAAAPRARDDDRLSAMPRSRADDELAADRGGTPRADRPQAMGDRPAEQSWSDDTLRHFYGSSGRSSGRRRTRTTEEGHHG